MTWMNPQAAWWLLLAAPIVLLYILRRQRRRLNVATTLFWQDVLRESRPRAWWRTLRRWISLLLQLLFLALLTAAIMDPLTSGRESNRSLHVLVVDHSASMNALMEPGDASAGTRLDAALRQAAGLVNQMGSHDEAVVIAASDRPRVRCGRTRHRKTLRQALDQVEPTDLPGKPENALDLASGLSSNGLLRNLVWISDRAPPPPFDKLPDLHWLQVGSTEDNVAITAFEGQTHPDLPSEALILVEVSNFSDKPHPLSLALSLNGTPYDSLFFELKPGGAESRVLSIPRDRSFLLEALIREPDALLTDNRAALLVTPPQPVSVSLPGEPNRFLEEALRAHPRVRLIGQNEQQDADLLVYYRTPPVELPDHPCLVLAPEQDGNGWHIGPYVDRPILTIPAGANGSTEPDPIMQFVDPATINVRQCRTLLPASRARVLLEADGEAVCTAWEDEGLRRLALSLDLSGSDLVLRTAFPILISNAVQWLVPSHSDRPWGYRTGDRIVMNERSAASTDLRRPDGRLDNLRTWTVQGLPLAGLYMRNAGEAPDDALLAVNLVHPGESNLRVEVSPGPSSDHGRFSTGVSFKAWPFWVDLVLAALLLSVGEWVAHQRRWVE